MPNGMDVSGVVQRNHPAETDRTTPLASVPLEP